MPTYTITPWRQPSDLLEVRSQLYPINKVSPALQSHAIQRIQAWKLRGNLPHAVESTALLLDALLHHSSQNISQSTTNNNNSTDAHSKENDESGADLGPNQRTSSTNSNTSPPISTFALRAVYSAAFTRFVTGFCDIGRAKERSASGGSGLLEASSMLEIARQIGMPAWFVGLRHEATHDELPGLGRLARATREGLEWLWGVYWVKIGDEDGRVGEKIGEGGRREVVEGEGDVRDEMVRVLKDFRKARRDSLRGKKEGNRKRAPDSGDQSIKATSDACVRLCDGGKDQMLATVLVQERLLIPSNRTLGQPLEGAYLIWDQLLNDLSQRIPDFRLLLLRSCVEKLTSSGPSHETGVVELQALVWWIRHFVEQDPSLATPVMKSCCLHSTNIRMQDLGRDMLETQSEFVEEWRGLFLASIGDGNVETGVAEAGEIGLDTDMADVQSIERTEEDATQGWSRALLPSATPIGIVA